MAEVRNCLIPDPPCNLFVYQSPAMQDYMMLQLLCAVATALGISVTCSAAGYAELAAGWKCLGSPAAINQALAEEMVGDLAGVDTSQPICMDPLVLAGAKAALICYIIQALRAPV